MLKNTPEWRKLRNILACLWIEFKLTIVRSNRFFNFAHGTKADLVASKRIAQTFSIASLKISYIKKTDLIW